MTIGHSITISFHSVTLDAKGHCMFFPVAYVDSWRFPSGMNTGVGSYSFFFVFLVLLLVFTENLTAKCLLKIPGNAIFIQVLWNIIFWADGATHQAQ